MKRKKTQPRGCKWPQTDFFTQFIGTWCKVDCVKEYKFHPIRRWRFDYAIPEHKVAIEVEGGVWTGGRHVNAKGFLADMEKYNTATEMGWAVLRCTPKALFTNATIEMIEKTIKTQQQQQNKTI